MAREESGRGGSDGAGAAMQEDGQLHQFSEAHEKRIPPDRR